MTRQRPDPDEVRIRARQLGREYLARGDARGWFEAVYAGAQGDAVNVPWADLEPNPNLIAWIDACGLRGHGRSALVVGCGLGDDAELLATTGFKVTAFDVAPTAIEWCRRRWAGSSVGYLAADLLALPPDWVGRFDFVFEAYTLQSLPPDLLPAAIDAVARCVAPGGSLLIIARGRDEADPADGPPFPLRRLDLRRFGDQGLREVQFEDYIEGGTPPARRFRVYYER